MIFKALNRQNPAIDLPNNPIQIGNERLNKTYTNHIFRLILIINIQDSITFVIILIIEIPKGTLTINSSGINFNLIIFKNYYGEKIKPVRSHSNLWK